MGACQADSTIRTPGSLAGAGARRVTTVASRPLSARTLKAALRRISQRTLSQDASSGKAGVPLSQDIVQKIVRPHQTQQNVLERAIPEKELRLEPIIVSKEGPVSFAQNGVNETELYKIQALVHEWLTGQPFGIVELEKSVFGVPPRPDILHRVVVWQHNMSKSGTANTQTRGSARGSNLKIRPQKGSGRARLGHRRSPMLAKGGRAHGPKPRNPKTKIQRKVVDLGKRIALSTKYAQRQMLVVDSLSMESDATGDLAKALASNGLKGRMVLLVYGNEEPEVNLIQAAMPYRRVLPIAARDVDVFNLLKYDTVVLDTAAVVVLEAMLGRK